MENTNRKTILFIPSYKYLSISIFKKLNTGFFEENGFDLLFFDLPDILDEKDFLEELKCQGNRIINFKSIHLNYISNFSRFNYIKKIRSLFIYFKAVRKFKQNIFSSLDELSPLAIVTTGETLTTLQCLQWAHHNNKKIIIIQPCYVTLPKLNLHQQIYRYLKYSIINIISKILSKSIISSENKLFGTTFTESNIIIFDSSLDKYYSNKKNKIHKFSIQNLQKYISKPDMLTYEYKKNQGNVLICIQNYCELSHIMSIEKATLLNKSYFDIINDNPKFNFLVKIHPRQSKDFDFYSNYFKKIKHNNYSIYKDIELEKLFDLSFVHISTQSFTAVEAILNGIPSINLSPKYLINNEFHKGDLEYQANNAEECSRMINYCLRDGFYEDFYLKQQKYIETNTQKFHVDSDLQKIILNIIR